MAKKLAGIEPAAVWDCFEQITQVPRPSKHEEKIAAFLVNWAKEHHFDVKRDAIGNVRIHKPATKGMENRRGVIIQGHSDMVCEKNPGVNIDFMNEGVDPYIDGDWVKAHGTTLGSDDGIALAMGMAILESNDIPHPEIELLATMDEETSLTGATSLDPKLLTGDILINIDSEVDGVFTIGCAGGVNTVGHIKYDKAAFPKDYTAYEIEINGLKGGHSGIQINEGRACASKMMTRIVFNLIEEFGVKLSSFDGGSKHNAIPRDAKVVIAVPNAKAKDFEKYMKDFVDTLKNEWGSKEPELNCTTKKVAAPKRVMSDEMQWKLIRAFYSIPHGVLRMSPDVDGLVQSSSNMAIVETREDEVYVLTNQRSSVESEKINISNKAKCALELAGATVTPEEGYPAWQPNIHSPILAEACKIYKNLFKEDPKIEIIHAGLECGLVGEKYPHMDMLSFGPQLVNVHTPSEQCQISSVQKNFKLLKEILLNIPEKTK